MKASKYWIHGAVAAAVLALGVVAGGESQEAWALEGEAQQDEIASLEQGPIVRRQMLHRASRLELEPRLAFTMNDAFIRNGLVGLSASYYLNDSVGFTASGGFGALGMDTSLRESFEAELEAENPEAAEETSYSRVGFLVDGGLVWVPAFGKMSLMQSVFSHYDFHLFGGMALINERVETAVDGGEEDSQLEGMRPAGMFGAGVRLFMSPKYSLNVQVRNYLFPRAEVSQQDVDPSLSNTVMLTVGLGIFSPGDVSISR